jgi:hypothetical protein
VWLPQSWGCNFDIVEHAWRVPAGRYAVALARSAMDKALMGSARIAGVSLPP